MEKQKDTEPENQSLYFTENGNLMRLKNGERKLVANFSLQIQKQIAIVDDEIQKGRQMEILLKSKGRDIPFTVLSDEFSARSFQKKILNVAGPSAILFGSVKDLLIGTQYLSGEVPEKILKTRGLTPDGRYLAERIVISPEGIQSPKDTEVFSAGGDFSRLLGLLPPDPKQVPAIASHLLRDFLELKHHRVTFPLIGHINLAPFTSEIPTLLNAERAALHLLGPSGGGKTYLARHGMHFFGQFGERIPSWTSTPNFLEAEGYWFRDALFLIDDLKQGLVPQETIIRILQNYSTGHGRGRLTSNSKILKPPFIRGLLLSTGEDFVTDVESITGRAICTKVEPEKNLEAGDRCTKYSPLYPMFTAGLIHSVISEPDWKKRAKDFFDGKKHAFYKETNAFPNGVRVASNWALNALGFDFFVNYLVKLKVINPDIKNKMGEEYDAIVKSHLQEQLMNLFSESPVEIFFRLISQKHAAGTVAILGLDDPSRREHGRIIGQVKKNSVMIFPDIAHQVLVEHFRSVGQRTVLSRNSLRDALSKAGLISQRKKGRWSTQFRGEGRTRHQAWEFDIEAFKKRVQI